VKVTVFCWMWLVAVVGRCVVGCEQCEGYCFLLDVVVVVVGRCVVGCEHCERKPSATNLEEEEIADAPGKDGNASMPEQVKRPNPWMMIMMMMIKITWLQHQMYQ